MKIDGPSSAAGGRLAMSEFEFVVLTALLVALTAFSIDVMLPAFPEIAGTYAVADLNSMQSMITAYMIGFAAGHPFFGPIADRFGRKIPLLSSLFMVFVAAIFAAYAPDYTWMLAARVFQGFMGAGARLVAVAIVRDLYGGRDMARIMSMVMSVFILVPVLAPGIGGLLIEFGHWRWTFFAIAVMALCVGVWSSLRLVETLLPEDRLPLRPGPIFSTMMRVATHRATVCYATAQGLLLASIFSYLGTAPQIFGDLYGMGALFPLAFGAAAIGLVISATANSRIVKKYGMRPISGWAAIAYIFVCVIGSGVSLLGTPPFAVTFAVLASTQFLFGLIMPNINALSMEPHGCHAGIASAFLGFYPTALGAGLGWVIGNLYNDTVQPLFFGYLALGLFMLLFMWLADTDRSVVSARD